MNRTHVAWLVGIVTASALLAGTAPTPWPPAVNLPISAFAMEHDGTGWALLNNGEPMYYDGKAYRRLMGNPPPERIGFDVLLGDAERGYYIQRYDHGQPRLNVPPSKRIYRLIDGEARLYCEPLAIEGDSPEFRRNTYVARDGRLISWNTQRIALWHRDAWTLLPAQVTNRERLPVIVEHAGHIIVVDAQTFHVIAPDGRLATRQPVWKHTTRDCFHWQGPVALRMVEEETGVEAFDLLSGAQLPLPSPFAHVTEPVTAMFRSSDGTPWAKTTNAVYRLGGADQVTRFDLPVEDVSIVAISETMSAGTNGTSRWDIFFADGRPGLWRWNAEGAERWDASHGVRGHPRLATLTIDRSLLFMSAESQGWRLLRLPLDAPRPPTEAEPERWQFVELHPRTCPMEMGGTIACVPAKGKLLRRWDGANWSEQPWPDVPARSMLSGTAWDDLGTVYLRYWYGHQCGIVTELTPTTATVVSDENAHDQHMLGALQRSANRGATRLTFSEEGYHAAITPTRNIWYVAADTGVVRHYDGIVWHAIPVGSDIKALTWSPRDGAVLRRKDGSTLVYTNGLFEPLTGLTPFAQPAHPAPDPELAETPLAGRPVYARHVDAKGNLWFWMKDECGAYCLRLNDLRLTARSVISRSHPDSLMIAAALSPTCRSARYEYRLNGETDWRSLLTPRGTPGRLHFPRSGIYTCEVAAVVFGARLPQAATFTHTACVPLPETRLVAGCESESPMLVTEYDWHPPVEAVPTAYVNRGVCEVVWREASSEAPWRPLDAAGRFPLRQLATNGVYRLAFAACEEKIQYDLSPVTMTIRL
ncbi:MAG: hypothetical protein PHR35_22065, partial [Kiritimatiellae bacterium]|nr:hypothetical protein [Kiritimatiellia bacterium]